MSIILVLGVSVLLQLAAVVIVIRLIRSVGGQLVWIVLASAILLMSVRRFISLAYAIETYPQVNYLLSTELVALVISALLLSATLLIRPFIESIKQSQQQLIDESQRNEVLLQNAPDALLIVNIEGVVQEVNQALCQMLGYRSDEILGNKISQLAHGDEVIRLKHWFNNVGANSGLRYESRFCHADGHEVNVDITARSIKQQKQEQLYVFVRDITETKTAQQKLLKQKEKAQVTLESIGDGVLTADNNGDIQYMNPVAEQLCGFSAEQALGKPINEVIRLVDEHSPENVINPISSCSKQMEKGYTLTDKLLLRQDKTERYVVEVVVSPLHDSDNNINGVVLVIHNVTELKSMAETLSYQASHDALTGLINRREFEIRLENSLDEIHESDKECALCYMDLDQFKIVNDTCGHIAGDELLKQVARVISSCIRETDTLARLGGDEFGVLLESCSMQQAQRVIGSIFNHIRDYRFQWENNVFEIGLSIGLVPVNQDSGGLTDVLAAADSACYVAKERGRNCMHVYVANDNAVMLRRGQMEWVQRIQQALKKDQFCLMCQSIQALNGDEHYRHIEVLLRLKGEANELIVPNEFIAAAERYHLMPDIDRWVLNEVFARIAENRCGTRFTDNSMIDINLSGQSLGDDSFLAYVLELFNRYQVPANSICFEITETAVISNIVHARNFISVLKDRGCYFALDDFGSGLSSFSYLKDLDVDFLKIDGSFVRSIPYSNSNYKMVASINHIGHAMGLKTIAEFVENSKILSQLEDIGVDLVQGFHIDEPYPIEQAIESLTS